MTILLYMFIAGAVLMLIPVLIIGLVGALTNAFIRYLKK